MDVEEIAKGLSEAQRNIMLGHMVEIPPREAEELEALGLKGEDFFHETGEGRRMVWPVTDDGLAVRAHILGAMS